MPLIKGALRIETITVVHPNGADKTVLALYQRQDGALSLLMDTLRSGEWSSTYLPSNVTERLHETLNRYCKEH